MAINQNETILNVQDLRISFKAYGGMVRAVRGVSFDLKRGETVAIVGESGSGKSVSIKSIMGILPPNAVIEEGKIEYDGMDLTKVSEDDFHKIRGNRIGLIFQDPLSALNPIMKIGKQITEVLHLSKKISSEEAKHRALELMHAVGIPEAERRFNQYPFQFSGGMRQRIVIAIALAGDLDLRRADYRTGRYRAGENPRADQQNQRRAPSFRHLHHARPWRRRQHGGPGERDVCRQNCGIGHERRDFL